MKTRLLFTWIATFAVAALAAGPANAILIAGWDFSQYISPGGFLSTDGATLVNTLGANYSNQDPDQLGNGSIPRGTMHIDGLFGSTLVEPTGQGNEPWLPLPGSLGANLAAPVAGGNTLQFDSLNELIDQGQGQANLLRMGALGLVDVVFEADTLALPGTDWTLSFGARSNDAPTTLVVEFSPTGSNYIAAGSPIQLTPAETPFTFNLTPNSSGQMFVRFRFDASGQGNLDNVAIDATPVPEPSTTLLLAAGLAGLAAWGRRRV